ncbi:hypothetical protein C1H46_004229 [Malus baccata]|uniref:Uncharacterized protein n=1 Tax=Malus baccata TaxID=106549 RepID=A0A540NHV4_MALBA|nr:hypothetical protein C1H46_004229 [Malus baccata]
MEGRSREPYQNLQILILHMSMKIRSSRKLPIRKILIEHPRYHRVFSLHMKILSWAFHQTPGLLSSLSYTIGTKTAAMKPTELVIWEAPNRRARPRDSC